MFRQLVPLHQQAEGLLREPVLGKEIKDELNFLRRRPQLPPDLIDRVPSPIIHRNPNRTDQANSQRFGRQEYPQIFYRPLDCSTCAFS